MLEEARAKGPPQVTAEADGPLGSRAWPKVGSRSSANLTTWKGGGMQPCTTQAAHGRSTTMGIACRSTPAFQLCWAPRSMGAVTTRYANVCYSMAKTGKAPNLKNLHVATQGIRLEAAKEAQGAEKRLGNPPEEMDRAEADVRVFAHDLTHYDHDKDYRCLIAFPSDRGC